MAKKLNFKQNSASRFKELETNWQDILTVLEWVKKVQAAFLDIPVPQAFADIAAQGPAAAPSNMELNQKYEASLKVLDDFEADSNQPMKYQNQHLKIWKSKLSANESKRFETALMTCKFGLTSKTSKTALPFEA